MIINQKVSYSKHVSMLTSNGIIIHRGVTKVFGWGGPAASVGDVVNPVKSYPLLIVVDFKKTFLLSHYP